jgi:hypothetical protein
MSTDSIQTVMDEPLHLLDDLLSLLETQIKLVRQGKTGDVELLSQQASSFVERIAQMAILELPEFKNRRGQLQKLYTQLCLAIAAQEADVTKTLSHIRRGRKAIKIYRNRI